MRQAAERLRTVFANWDNGTSSDSVSVSVGQGDTVGLVARLDDGADYGNAYIDANVDVSTLRIQ